MTTEKGGMIRYNRGEGGRTEMRRINREEVVVQHKEGG